MFCARRKNLLLTALSLTAALVSAAFPPRALVLWSLMPLLCLETDSFGSAWRVAFAHTLGASHGIVAGSRVFFGDATLFRGAVLWLSSAAVLALPWGLIQPLPTQPSLKFKIRNALKTVMALFIAVPPPLGVICWTSPLTTAGLFFPGSGWSGLMLLTGFYAAAANFSRLRRFLIAFVLTAALFFPTVEVAEPVRIRGFDTSFGRLASGSAADDTQYERERQVFRHLRMLRDDLRSLDIAVLPETVVGRMHSVTERRWRRFFRTLAPDTVFIAGAEIPKGLKYDNAMIAFAPERGDGERRQKATQRIPVPFSMYLPFAATGARGYPFGGAELSTLTVRGVVLGFLICYEQFLVWPVLSLMFEKPDVLVAPANLWWCRDTPLPGIRLAALRCWARLFGVPVVSAVNM